MMMGKKGGKRKVLVALQDSDSEDEEHSQPLVPQYSNSKSNQVSRSAKPTTGISKPQSNFQPKISTIVNSDDSDEEEDKITSFKIRKSKQSRKIEKKKRDAKFLGLADQGNKEKESAAKSNFYSSGIDYSKENMDEMKKEFTVRLVNNQSNAMELNEERTMVMDDEDFIHDMEPALVKYDAYASQAPQNNTLIPTDDRIAQIRMKRDRLRNLGVTSSEYIALHSHQDEDNSGLIREDDHDANEEHEYDDWNQSGNRRSFGDPNTRTNPEKKTLYDLDMEEEDDEEANQWEKDQLAKVGIKAPKPKVLQPENPLLTGGKANYYGDKTDSNTNLKPTSIYKPTDVNFILKKIRENLQEMKEVREEHLQQQDNVKAELVELQMRQTEKGSSSSNVNQDLQFFQDLRDYCFDLMDCLEEKSNEVLKLYKKLFSLAVETATAIRRRKADFIEDELVEVREILGESNRSMMSTEKEDLRKERRGYQRRKQENREARKSQRDEEEDDPEGWSSDEEETNMRTKLDYNEQREELVEEGKGVMDDAHSEFATLTPILARFGEWKDKYPDSYTQAYGTLSLQKVCDTFVRQEMLVRWEPLNFPPITFEEYEWYEELIEYLKKSDHQGAEFRTAERQMLQNIITTIVMEPFKQAILHVYNPFSTRETNLVLENLKDFSPVLEFAAVSAKLKEIIITAHVTIQGYIDSLVVLSPPPEKLQRSEIVSYFCYRQFWTSIKLFSNIMMWYKTFAINIIEDMCIGSLLDSKIIPFLRTIDSERVVVEALEKIVKAMSPYTRDAKGVPAKLFIFHDFAYKFAKNLLEKSKQDSNKLSIRALLVLKKMNDAVGAKDLASKYKIKVSL
jgi:hypothetical protein